MTLKHDAETWTGEMDSARENASSSLLADWRHQDEILQRIAGIVGDEHVTCPEDVENAVRDMCSERDALLVALKDLRAMVIGEHGASAYENVNGERADAAIAKAEGR